MGNKRGQFIFSLSPVKYKYIISWNKQTNRRLSSAGICEFNLQKQVSKIIPLQN